MVSYSNIPSEVGAIHFVGIGGVGMSGIAEILANLGYHVQGSDITDSDTVQSLRKMGVKIFIGHNKQNIRDCSVVVVSSAILESNPEILEAKAKRIPILKRAEMLSELMRFRFGIAIAGTHGKTTTTSLVAALLSEAGIDPTCIVGGKVTRFKSSASLGQSRYLVAEADESDASFLHLNPVIAVLTNIDSDHLVAYEGDFNRLKSAFHDFLLNLPFYGTAIVCHDDPVLREFSVSISRNFLTYGFSDGSDIRAFDFRFEEMYSIFKVSMLGREDVLEIKLHLPGKHNILNSLAALAVCHQLNVNEKSVIDALAQFGGISRRFQIHGEICFSKGSALLIDDYGHHPTEITATLEAVRNAWPSRRLVLMFQPHRYTRTQELFDDFVKVLGEADYLVLFDIYPAGESSIKGINTQALCDAIDKEGEVEWEYARSLESGISTLNQLVVDSNNIVLTMGAGSVSALAPMLLKELNCNDAA